MSAPVIKIEIDLTSAEFVALEDLELGGAIAYETANAYDTEIPYSGTIPFTDITSAVQSARISRGRSSFSYDHFESGTATLEIIDFDSQFLPTNTNSPFFPNITAMRPIRISAEYEGQTTRLFRGYIDRWDIEWRPQQSWARITVTATDATKIIANLDTEFTGSDGDTPGERINAMLDDKNWPQAFRDIDLVGHSTTLVEETADRRKMLPSLQDIEFADAGALFVDGAGRIVYKGRNSAYPGGIEYTFSDALSAGVVPYIAIKITVDDEQLYNFVSITNPLGNEQTALDAQSIAKFQERAFIRGDVIVETDAQALSLAEFILDRNRTPQERVNYIEIDPRVSSSASEAVMGIDLLTTAQIQRGAPGNVAYSEAVFIVGLQHDITVRDWRTTYYTQHQYGELFRTAIGEAFSDGIAEGVIPVIRTATGSGTGAGEADI